jgi:hypothetical protein
MGSPAPLLPLHVTDGGAGDTDDDIRRPAEGQATERGKEQTMTRATMAAALLVALPVSSLLVGCADRGDSGDRLALDRQALERDLDLVLKPDTTAEVALVDLPLPEPETEAPTPAPEAAPPQAVRQPLPRPQAPRAAAPAPARPAEPQGPRYVTRSVPGGSTLSLRINEEISTRSARVGQSFSATLLEPMRSADGSVVIPAGATVRGQVTRAHVSGNAGERAELAVSFTSVSHGGQTHALRGTVVSPPHVRTVNRDTRAQTAAKVGGGAAAGAVVGRVIGRDTRSTVAGAAIGAAAGTAVAIGTASVDAVISPGTTATVRLDAPVQVRTEVR